LLDQRSIPEKEIPAKPQLPIRIEWKNGRFGITSLTGSRPLQVGTEWIWAHLGQCYFDKDQAYLP
jgi:hypothetical protein